MTMPPNRDKLRRRPDGRFEAGVYIKKNEYALYIPQVYLPYSYGDITHLAKTLDAEPTFELAAMAARSWAERNVPGAYKFAVEDLVITLMDKPEFDEKSLPKGMG
jgi:hypothetical protein